MARRPTLWEKRRGASSPVRPGPPGCFPYAWSSDAFERSDVWVGVGRAGSASAGRRWQALAGAARTARADSSADRVSTESERLLAKLEAAPTLQALNAYEEQLRTALQQLSSCTDCVSAENVWKTLKPALEGASTQVLEAQRDVQTAVQRYGRVLDKQFRADLSGIHVHKQFPGEQERLNYTIGMHLIRQANFGVAETFMKETNLDLPAHVLQAFEQLYHILNALRNEDFQTAIEWTFSKREILEQRGSNLEFELHKLQFISILTRNDSKNYTEAIKYARTHFPAFSEKHLKEIKQLMCFFCYTSDISLFPYKELYTRDHLWASVQALFSREYCSLIGFSPDSPLQTVSIAGSLAIPTLLKMSSIMKEKKTEWTSQNELPVEIPLPSKYQFHSVFTCPISKEQTTESNPPLMIPCGHVISKNSIERLSKDNPTNKFKCPYCPKETTPQEAILLYL
ncbi:hypothetical protein PORY_000998 [Pneumocystis oryctolagi]|uniref:Uncharacterized protein n=1 Tax=Pneumocystis oryctolagi TaxID=42067 RepID=A0ACB7CFY6_9ASCO|nr:hypothetical protein PORY_000998 [Pneumocystis oryctolagi]